MPRAKAAAKKKAETKKDAALGVKKTPKTKKPAAKKAAKKPAAKKVIIILCKQSYVMIISDALSVSILLYNHSPFLPGTQGGQAQDPQGGQGPQGKEGVMT
jgi:hypothetical protein